MNGYKYAPVLFFAALFALDKIALIPGVAQAGKIDRTPLENMTDFAGVEMSRLRGEKLPVYSFFGTSRSEPFKYLGKDEIRSSSLISAAEKNDLMKASFATATIIRASENFVTLNGLMYLIREGKKPDLAVVEISPEMFNGNSPFNAHVNIQNNVIHRDVLRSCLPLLDGDDLREVQARYLFAMYGSRFRPEAVLRRAVFGSEDENYFVKLALNSTPSLQPLPANYLDYDRDRIPEEIYRIRFAGYAVLLQKDNILRNFVFSPEELRLVEEIITVSENNDIPLVLWMPRVHPLIQEIWKSSPFNNQKQRIVDLIKSRGVPFYDGNTDEGACRLFTDSSHLSWRCGPHLITQIQKLASGKYGTRVTQRALR